MCRRVRPETSIDRFTKVSYLVDDLLEPDFHRTAVQIFAPFRVVNQFAQFALSHLACTVSEYKQHGIDGVGLPGTVGSNNS